MSDWTSQELYRPCLLGIHVCGQDAQGIEPITLLNLPRSSADDARAAFTRAKAALAEPNKEDFDVVVDLMIGGDIVEDFGMRRQMIDRLMKIVA